MTTVDIDKELKGLETPKAVKIKKPFAVNKPPQQYYDEPSKNNHFKNHLPIELKNGSKNLALYGLAFPVPPKKKGRMMYNLQSSKYINDYLNKYMCVDQIVALNDHAKFGLCYGMCLLDTFMMNDIGDANPIPPAPDAPMKESDNNVV